MTSVKRRIEQWFESWYEYSWNKEPPSEEIKEIKEILKELK
jgi:hypothetical protein